MEILKTTPFENISDFQREQLNAWLCDHTYPEVQALIAAPVPEGFGIEVSIPTLSRYYKKNFFAIDSNRQDMLSERSLRKLDGEADYEGSYRDHLGRGATLFLQERFYDILTHPISSVDDLRKLASVAKIIKDLWIQTDPAVIACDKVMARMIPHPVYEMVAQSMKTGAAASPHSPPADPSPADSGESAPPADSGGGGE